MLTLPALEQSSGVHALLERKLVACDELDRVVGALRDGRRPAAPASPLELFVALGGRTWNLARLDPLLPGAAALDVRLVDDLTPGPELAALVGRAADQGVFVTLVPGAAVLPPETIRAFVVARLGRLTVELAGASARRHDAVAGAGRWDVAWRVLETLHEERLAGGVRWPEPSVHVEARFEDLADLPGLVVKLAGVGVTRLTLRVTETRGLRPLELVAVAESAELAETLGMAFHEPAAPDCDEPRGVCVHRFAAFAVDPLGVIYPCAQGALRAVDEYAVGGIEADDPFEVWRGAALEAGRERAQALEYPAGCAWCLGRGDGKRHDDGHPTGRLREATHIACQNLALDTARRGGGTP